MPVNASNRVAALILSAMVSAMAVADGGAGSEPPVVPATPIPAAASVAAARPAPAPAEEIADVATVAVQPGVNLIIPVSAGHLNRIVTPFANPKARTTTSDLTTEVSGSVIYVSPPPDRPATLFVTDGDDESQALSLTLLPKAIAPREIHAKLTGSAAATGPAKAAEKWEKAQPYQDTIKAVMRDLALGKVPSGYAMGEGPPDNPPVCRQEGLAFAFAQQVLGHNLWVAVGVVENTTNATLEFYDESCMSERRAAAVAAWPDVMLPPGGRSEVYVVMRRDTNAPGDSRPARPSLLAGYPAAIQSAPQPAAVADSDTDALSSGLWAVQVGAFSDERSAREMVRALRAKGYTAESKAGKGGLHYVRLGLIDSREDAAEIAGGLRSLGYDPLVVQENLSTWQCFSLF